MSNTRKLCSIRTCIALAIVACVHLFPLNAWSETGYDDAYRNTQQQQPQPPPPSAPTTPTLQPAQRNTESAPSSQRRKYFQEDPNRIDAGIFHVSMAAGGNFYIEPEVDPNKVPTGNFFKDIGFQAGVYFDYDYSELDQNIPLMLRGMVGYKYVLSSVHVFTFDGMVRNMWRWSERASFGLGMGGSAALWYRTVTSTSSNEELVVLPSLLLGAGFEFHPFMVDFKWLINRIASDNILMGFELYFGFRL